MNNKPTKTYEIGNYLYDKAYNLRQSIKVFAGKPEKVLWYQAKLEAVKEIIYFIQTGKESKELEI